MVTAFRIVAPPDGEPLTLEEVKLFLKVRPDEAADDARITRLMTGVRRAVEKRTEKLLMTAEVAVYVSGALTGRVLTLPIGPIQNVVSVKSYDDAGVETVFDAGQYYLDTISDSPALVLRDAGIWPTSLRSRNGLIVTVTAGYGDPEDVPEDLTEAMLTWIGLLYENREAAVTGTIVQEMPFSLQELLEPYTPVSV